MHTTVGRQNTTPEGATMAGLQALKSNSPHQDRLNQYIVSEQRNMKGSRLLTGSSWNLE